jgi:hypothetical protein
MEEFGTASIALAKVVTRISYITFVMGAYN